MASDSTFEHAAQIAPHHLAQANSASVIPSTIPYELQNYVPQVNMYDNSDRRFSTISTNSTHNAYQAHARRTSQQDAMGSPASSYAPSLSDGRRGSMSYQQPAFKVPTHEPRMSLPMTNGHVEQPLSSTFAGQQGQPRDMHGSQWTPNFSFGAPSVAGDLTATQRTSDQYKNYLQSVQTNASSFVMPVDRAAGYNYDRRMSHPVLSSGSFETPVPAIRGRQTSAIDWRTFSGTTHGVRPVTNEGIANMSGIDGLWNTLDSARGMVAMSNSAHTNSNAYKQNMDRRRSMPYVTSSTIINEDLQGEGYEPYENSGIFGNSSIDLSDDGSNPLQPVLGADGQPDQASMMTTFNAKDTNSGHKKHVCPVCKKRFTRPSSLTTHIYSHTGEKPFICEVDGCGRHFSVISNLRRHKKIHAQAGTLMQPEI